MTIEKINPMTIEAQAKKKGFKAMTGGSGFNAMLDAAGAIGPTAMLAGQMYGTPNSATVLSAAFSGVGATSAQLGSGAYGSYAGTPYLAAGYSGGYKSAGFSIGDPNAPVIPGAEMSQMDMINVMNQNNLQLLELQAVMQNNMQAWNTKSNILSADHRARMAMIEKFTARG